MALGAQQAQRANRGVYHNPWDNIFLVSYLDIQPPENEQTPPLATADFDPKRHLNSQQPMQTFLRSNVRLYERNGRLFAAESTPQAVYVIDKPDIEVVGYNFDPRFLVPPVPPRIEDIKERYYKGTTQMPTTNINMRNSVPYSFERSNEAAPNNLQPLNTPPRNVYYYHSPVQQPPSIRNKRRRDALYRQNTPIHLPGEEMPPEENTATYFESDLETYPVAQR